MKKVFVGLSGGVDSSVSALILKNKGFDVTGVFIKAWHPAFLPCNWRSEMHDAMRICARLDIPFLMCDLEREYKNQIIDNLIEEYKLGHTPNPDVLCNEKIKFGAFYDFAMKNGADFVATGHYAQIKNNNEGQPEMHISKDSEKDQTYFLWAIEPDRLEKIIFPIGNLNKKEVREIAKKGNLNTADKKDSQGLCFLGHVDMKNFLKRYIETRKGSVIDGLGKIIGQHDGAELYTLGERHGFKLDNKDNDSTPHYVISKDLDKNTITVSEKKLKMTGDEEIKLKKVNLFVNLDEIINGSVGARVRYRGELLPVQIMSGGEGELVLNFTEKKELVAPGQSIVLYRDGKCLGGGIVI